MHSLLQSATTADDLLRVDDPALPYSFGDIFQGEGFRARRRQKEHLKLIKELDASLRPMLAEGEVVRFITTANEYSFFESYFMGMWAWFLNRRAVVLTNKRILLLQVNTRRKLLDLRYEVHYAAIKKIQRGMLGYVRLVLEGAKPLMLMGIPGPDKKRLRALLDEAMQTHQGESVTRGRENLCPHCAVAVQGLPAACPTCGGEYKSGAKAGLLSLLFPGFGDLYLGHRGLAVVEILGALCVWVVVVPVAIGSIGEESGTAGAAFVVIGILFAMIHGMDALVTRHTGRKGLYPQR